MDQGDINSLFLLASTEPLPEQETPGTSSKYDRTATQQQQNILLQTKSADASPEQAKLPREQAKDSFIYEAIDNLKSPPSKAEALSSRSKASASMTPPPASSGGAVKPGRQSRKQQQQQASSVLIEFWWIDRRQKINKIDFTENG
jgi:hypothetical protein